MVNTFSDRKLVHRRWIRRQVRSEYENTMRIDNSIMNRILSVVGFYRCDLALCQWIGLAVDMFKIAVEDVIVCKINSF